MKNTQQPILPNLPEAVDTEKLVLGVLLDDPDAASAILALEAADFYITQHQQIFETARWCHDHGQQITIGSVMQRLTDTGRKESVGGISYVAQLAGVSKIIGLETYLQILRNKATLRRCAIAAYELAERCCMPGAEVEEIRTAEAFVREIVEGAGKQDGGPVTFQEVLDQRGGIDAFLKPKVGVCVPTQWPKLNALLTGGGFMPGQLVIIGARTGLGKSALVSLIASYAKKQGVVVFSLEMSRDETFMRMIASAAGVPLKPLMEGKLYDQEARKRVVKAMGELAGAPLRVDDRTGSHVGAMVRAVKRIKGGVKLVIVDYLQLVRPSGKGRSRVEDVGELSRSLKLAANELNVPLVVCAQVNRDAPKTDRAPQLHDLRESGSIEMDANTVIFLHASQTEVDQAIANKRPSDLELIIRKQRNGPTGKVNLVFDASEMTIEEKV